MSTIARFKQRIHAFLHPEERTVIRDHDVAILRRILADKARAMLVDEEFPVAGLGDTQVLTHPELPHAIFRAEERVAEQIDPWQA